jgi:hypothetical protein
MRFCWQQWQERDRQAAVTGQKQSNTKRQQTSPQDERLVDQLVDVFLSAAVAGVGQASSSDRAGTVKHKTAAANFHTRYANRNRDVCMCFCQQQWQDRDRQAATKRVNAVKHNGSMRSSSSQGPPEGKTRRSARGCVSVGSSSRTGLYTTKCTQPSSLRCCTCPCNCMCANTASGRGRGAQGLPTLGHVLLSRK